MSNVARMTPKPMLAVAGRIPQFVLSDRLRKAREEAEMTQTELADLMGISRRSVSYYESGDSVPKRPQLIAWAMATGVKLAWLETGQPLLMKGPDDEGWAPRGSNPEPTVSVSIPARSHLRIA